MLRCRASLVRTFGMRWPRRRPAALAPQPSAAAPWAAGCELRPLRSAPASLRRELSICAAQP